MAIVLTPHEARVIGCLLEKEITTPEQYPLSLNALTNACNQKSNRDPVMELDETTVQQTLDSLVSKHLVSNQTGYGSRVTKYQHRFCNTEFGKLQFSPRELGLLCELFLRGPQTPGELRTHASRLCPLNEVSQVDTTLQQLTDRADGPFVVRLARQPGRRESRYAQLFSGEVGNSDDEELIPGEATLSSPPVDLRIDTLEQRVVSLEAEVATLRALLAVRQ